MKSFIFIFVSLLLLVGCSTTRVLTPEEHLIPDYYHYVHSWDYPSPDGNGTIHCDEHGTIDFRADGTYSDTAYQTCYIRRNPDTLYDQVELLYACQGRWKVENHKFLFNEMAEDFTLNLVNPEKASPEERYYAPLIKKYNTPNTQRWFTFDIRRLDHRWFVWTYTYPDGRVDSWDMRRASQRETNTRNVTPWHTIE